MGAASRAIAHLARGRRRRQHVTGGGLEGVGGCRHGASPTRFKDNQLAFAAAPPPGGRSVRVSVQSTFPCSKPYLLGEGWLRCLLWSWRNPWVLLGAMPLDPGGGGFSSLVTDQNESLNDGSSDGNLPLLGWAFLPARRRILAGNSVVASQFQ